MREKSYQQLYLDLHHENHEMKGPPRAVSTGLGIDPEDQF